MHGGVGMSSLIDIITGIDHKKPEGLQKVEKNALDSDFNQIITKRQKREL